MSNRTQWEKESISPTAYTKQVINPTNWQSQTPFVATGALLLSSGGFLELSDGNVLGIYET